MKEEIFHISFDPHPLGQLRLVHVEGGVISDDIFSEMWDFETMKEPITIRRASGIISRLDCNAVLYLDYDVMDFINSKTVAMEDELESYKRLLNRVIDPHKKAAVATNNNRSAGKNSRKNKPPKV
jgi:hypothetical protein